MADEVVKHRIDEAIGEAERALENLRQLAEHLQRGHFTESFHDAAKSHLQAALSHLDSLRHAPLAPPPPSEAS